MKSNKNLWIAMAVVTVIAVGGYMFPKALDLFGASGTRFPNGLSADSTSPVAGELRGADLTLTDDATIAGGVLNVTTAANATSTIVVGCINTYATSSATAIKQVHSTLGATSTFAGTVYWSYGHSATCN